MRKLSLSLTSITDFSSNDNNRDRCDKINRLYVNTDMLVTESQVNDMIPGLPNSLTHTHTRKASQIPEWF